jgi:3',5'-cyclic AMP phosphodiesterase CpdA
MLTLLHMSDLHFGPPYVPKVGEAVLRIAAALHPDAIVISGDLTQRAKRQQFIRAREFIDLLPRVPKLVVPGNHDVPLYRVAERILRPHALYRKYIAADLNQVLRLDNAVLVALDSTAPRSAITNGRLHRGQLDFCREAFDDAPPEAARIVVAHHHFAPAPDYIHDETMPRSKRAMRRFMELGVELIMGGHLHRAYVGNSLDFFPSSNGDRGIIIAQSGTTTSRRGRGREREKNSFNLIQIGSEVLQITHYMFFDEEGEFGPLSRHEFPRRGSRFIAHHLLHRESPQRMNKANAVTSSPVS